MGRNLQNTTESFDKPNIIVVDNSNIDLRLLVNILSEKNYTVRPMLNGISALNAIKAQPPDLIILDVRMPEMDGYEVCRKLKSIEEYQSIPIIFISASDEVFDKVRAFSHGAVDYITKPYQAEEVLARVKTHLMIYYMKKKVEEQNIRLENEISERLQIESELKIHREKLEDLVLKRTMDLKVANENLINEIRERKKIEEDLRKSQQLLQGISDNAEALIYVKDISGRYLMVNRQFTKWLGLELSDIVGKKSDELFPANTMEQIERGFSDALKSETPIQREETYHIGNSLRTFISSRFPLLNPDSEPYGVAGILFDISYRKRAEEEINRLNLELEKRVIERTSQLRKANLKLKKAMENSQRMAEKADLANRAKSQFLANMSHEIRTPLNGIIGNTILALDTPLTTNQKEFLESIHISADHLLEVINDILDFSKIEAGHLELEKVNFNIRETIQSALEALEVKAREKKLSINYKLMDNVPEFLLGDPLRIRQILFNLGGNAIKFTQNGEISITCKLREKESDHVKIYFSVSDTGIGISPEQMQRIFSSFEQADGSISRKYGGTGLGLSITRQLVEKMGGNIWVTSEINKGSTFHFYLSLKPSDSAEAEVPITMDGPEVSQSLKGEDEEIRKLKILLAEDNYINQRMALHMLEKMGHTVHVAENGEKAISMYESDSFDIILMDIQMPTMDGIAATQKIRRIESQEKKFTPIIAMTAHALKGDREKCLSVGMDDYISKPIDPVLLSAALKKWQNANFSTRQILQKIVANQTNAR